jgi:hypothetical protein
VAAFASLEFDPDGDRIPVRHVYPHRGAATFPNHHARGQHLRPGITVIGGQRASRSLWCGRVNIESCEHGDDCLAVHRDVSTLPIPVLGGYAEYLSQVVERRVQFCHGANLGRYQSH